MVGKRKLRVELASNSDPLPMPPCPLCGRTMILGSSVDEHHLVPKSQGGKEKFLIHRICHRKIHATFSEKQLAQDLASWQALQKHEAIAPFIAWVRKKPPEYYDNSRKIAALR